MNVITLPAPDASDGLREAAAGELAAAPAAVRRHGVADEPAVPAEQAALAVDGTAAGA